MPKSLKISLLAVSAALLLTVFLGANIHNVRAASEPQDGAYRQMQVYSEVLQHIQSDYVVDPNMQKVTNGALRGLLESLDSDSSYLTPAEFKAWKANSNPGKGQLGMNVAKRYGYATVVNVIPNGPADKAGLSDGDVIESIGDRTTRDLSLASIDLMLAGNPGKSVALSVIRPRHSTPEKLDLKLEQVPTPQLSESVYDQGSILYLKPSVLDHQHVQEIESKIKGMNRAGNKKILLDLRDTSTGDNTEALRLANFFVKTGTLATLEGQKFPKQAFSAEPKIAINTTAPLVILVNHGTAGPAELTAGALLDLKRSELVGDKTFGDGSQQKTFDLPDGAAIILSIAKYETPSGKKFQDEGLTPTVQITDEQEAVASADEATAEENSTATVNSSKPSVPAKTLAKPELKSDDQLNKALDVLRAKNA